MKTRIFTLLMAFLATLSGAVWGQENWIDNANTDWYKENGTTFEISTAEELAGLAKLVNEETDGFKGKTIILTHDIDLNPGIIFNKKATSETDVFTGTAKEWTPISENAVVSNFNGTFDGNGHTISGLYLKSNIESEYEHLGLFGLIAGTIQNVHIDNSYIDVSINEKLKNIGGIAGNVDGFGSIVKCSFDGLINIKGDKAKITSLNVGGICGLYENERIESCCNMGNINVSMDDISYNGESYGQCGIFISGISNINSKDKPSANIDIVNSYNTGTINVSVNEFGNKNQNPLILYTLYISGIGNNPNKPSTITSCYNTGEIKVSGQDNTCAIYIGGINANEMGNEITNCYNVGTIESTVKVSEGILSFVNVGSISGSINNTKFSNNYYLQQKGVNAVGGNNNDSYNNKGGEIEKATEEEFIDGTVAYELRKAGGNYGQDLHSNTPAESPTLLCFTPDDAVYKLTLNYESYDETAAAEQYANSGYLNLPELEENAGWYDGEGNLYTSESAISEDITLYAQKKTAHTITIVDTEGGTVASDKTTAIVGETITLTVTTGEGYTFGGLSVVGTEAIETTLTGENIYTFTMPDADVTVTAQFTKNEEPTDPDEGDDEQGGIVPDAPKYYNIYEEEICEGVTVEFSRDVVKEGQSVLVTIKVDEEFDTTDLALTFKRSLFGYWEDLTLTPTENPNEYIIENIYTDIYVRAEGAVPTGIENIEGAKVYTKDGSIYVYTPTEEKVTIISASGAVMKNETQVGLKQYTGLQRGIYIICIDEQRFKVRL